MKHQRFSSDFWPNFKTEFIDCIIVASLVSLIATLPVVPFLTVLVFGLAPFIFVLILPSAVLSSILLAMFPHRWTFPILAVIIPLANLFIVGLVAQKNIVSLLNPKDLFQANLFFMPSFLLIWITSPILYLRRIRRRHEND